MKRCFLLFFLFSIVWNPGFTQQPEEKLNRWTEQFPIEKVYLHFDREEYVAGQTIWLKAYLSSDFLPADKSTALFVELINSSSTVLLRQSLPVVRAVSQGQFELPDTLTAGRYIIRAYTATMLNNNADFVYKRSISISGKERKNISASTIKNIRLEFFPEGGNFVAGQPNTIAFKATDQDGWPVNVKGTLKNSKHEIISEFSSTHDGMGMFDLDAEMGAGYYAELKDEPTGQKYLLPDASDKGIVFRLLNAADGIHFEIFQKKNDPVFEAAYMIGQMQHHSVFKQPLKQGATTLTGIINTSNLSSGILHITIFNKDGMPLAERLSFVNNKEYIKEAQLITDTLDLSPRGKNHFSIAFKDSVTGSFSVSISDPAYSSLPVREENIFSSFLLTSDLKGYVHNPAYYFSSDTDSVKHVLDLLMMTNGWRRFKWEQLLKEPLPAGKYNDPAFITLSGRVTLEDSKKPFADKDLLLFIISADSSRSMRLIRTDNNGYYNVDSILFFGKTKIMFSDIRGKRSLFIDLKPGPDSLNRIYPVTLIDKKDFIWAEPTSIDQNKKFAAEYEAIIKANGIILSEVVLQSRKKTPLQELDDKYSSGAFATDARKTFDLVNSDEAKYYQSVWDFLRAKGVTPGMRNMPTISSLGDFSTDIFLDEFPVTDPSVLDVMPMNKIAMIKVYSTFSGSWGNGPGGAIAIYSKKGEDLWNSIPSTGKMLHYNGFSVIKEFYSPNYSVPQKNNSTPDQRITLYWKPDIFVNGKDIKVPISFYNNDRSRSFKIVVEGMTTDGKMLMIEKTITGKAF